MPDAGIVAYHNFDIERSLACLPAYAVARFTRSVPLSRTARNCAFLPDTERTFICAPRIFSVVQTSYGEPPLAN